MQSNNLLIHSMAEFSSITLPVLKAVNAKVIAEIGSEPAGNSKLLYDWLHDHEGKLISIDAAPGPEFHDWLATTQDIVTHIPKASIEAIADVKNADAWFIDGDHNWYTVYNELLAIQTQAQLEQRPLLIFLHNAGWPWGRRDHYDAPERIPAEFCLPYTLDSNELSNHGLPGEGKFAMATTEGGERNGVLTAIEDFVTQYPEDFCWAFIPGVFGLGILFSRNHPQAQAIAHILAPLHEHPLLAKLEENRLANYLALIELQHRQRQLESQTPA